jgi:hypothetical protein
MGRDSEESSNKFYTSAERFFRAHVPGATFITDKPTLAELLAYIDKIKDPAGRIYIVSHANEDGTLSFGLSPGDTNRKLSVAELREALHPKAGPSRLADVGDKIDARTRIRIKGCDIGRTREMVELLDEAFGGLGTVTAPTHEQEYGYDSTEAERAERSARPDIEKAHPAPPPVDASLKGAAKKKAEAARKKELAKREKAIADEVRAAGEKGGTYEAFSGPMFQRPGTKLFSAAELAPEIKRLYGHLGAARQNELATLLTTPDPRTDAVAESSGTVGQRGQRLYRKRTFVFTHNDPQSLDEALKAFTKSIPKHFTASSFNIGTPVTGPDGTTFKYTLSGRLAPPKQQAQAYTLDFTSEPVPTDAALLSKGRAQVSNPDAYNWRIERSHGSDGKTTLKVIGERVLAYLHHESLDIGPHQHFTRPESDKDFFTTSTFAPNAGAASPSGGKK